MRRDKSIHESCYIKTRLDYNIAFPIDLAPSGIPFDVESIGRMK